jgi:adenine phosphoribosyltransferase
LTRNKNESASTTLKLQFPRRASEVAFTYDGQLYYELRLNHHSWKLPLMQIDNDTWIAYFDSLGEITLLKAGGKILAKEMRDCDVILTSESKGIALAHVIADILTHSRFVVCRKEVKRSMKDPIVVKYKPITSDKELTLCLDSNVAKLLAGKRVGLVDDIVSTGATFEAMEKLVKKAHGRVQKKAALLLEGVSRPGILHLGVLPVFKSHTL